MKWKCLVPVTEYNKSFPTDPDILPEIEEFVMNIAQEANLSQSKYNNLALSVAEAASNSMIHGNKMNKKKKVEITVKFDDKKMEITFKDEGNGFDLTSVPDPTKAENILKDSGRGIHIMRSFLDDLSYQFTPAGTIVTLVLKLK